MGYEGSLETELTEKPDLADRKNKTSRKGAMAISKILLPEDCL
jgi:hypothetical protein